MMLCVRLRLVCLLLLVPKFHSLAIPRRKLLRMTEIYRKEVIKATILDKLGLSREPELLHRQPPVQMQRMPPPLRRLYPRGDRPAHPARPGQWSAATVYKVVVFPSTDPTLNGTNHLQFKLPSTVGSRVVSATLSAYHGLPEWRRELPSRDDDERRPSPNKTDGIDMVRRHSPVPENLKDYSKIPSSMLVHLEQRAILGNPGREKVIRIGSKWVDFRLPGWAEFDVTELTNFWLGSPKRNGGLDIRCLTCNKHMRNAPFYINPDEQAEGARDRPFMVLTLQELEDDDEGSGFLRESLRHKRDVVNDCDEEDDDDDSDDADDWLTLRNATSPSPEGQRSCCRRSLVVSFKEIGWDGWVVEPAQFDAHYCLGQCASYNLPSPHAAIMEQVMSPLYEMKPCCVPVPGQMRDLHIRYSFDGGRTISTQRVPDIIVNSCGCL